jgi:hypothetical protein
LAERQGGREKLDQDRVHRAGSGADARSASIRLPLRLRLRPDSKTF